MKTFTFKYAPKPAKKAFTALKEAARSGKADLRPDTLYCESLEGMLKLMSHGRFTVYDAILNHRPDSIYQLAKLLERDQANVLKDVKALEALHLIKIELEKDGERERSRPVALYDKIVLEYESIHKKVV
jgi:predicted transcriptional regulator